MTARKKSFRGQRSFLATSRTMNKADVSEEESHLNIDFLLKRLVTKIDNHMTVVTV